MPKTSDLLGIFGSVFTIGSKSLTAGLRRLAFRSGSFLGAIDWTPTANRTIVLPDLSGTVVLEDQPIGSLNSGVSVRGYFPIVTVSASKTLALSDGNTTQLCTAASTITIPLNATAAFPIGTEITIFRNTSGTISLALTGGVTVTDRDGAPNPLTDVRNFTLLKKAGTDAWVAVNPIPNSAFLPGNPTTTTQPAGTNNTTIATTAYVKNEIATLGLLVYAQQTTAVALTTSGVPLIIPFDTEILDTGNFFSGGFFTPAFTGIYRLTCNLFFFSGGFADLMSHGAAVFQGSTNIGWMLWTWEREWNGSMIPGELTISLTGGLPYHVRAQAQKTGVSISTSGVALASGTVKNYLSIERLS